MKKCCLLLEFFFLNLDQWRNPDIKKMVIFCYFHCVKSVRIRSYSGPHFSRIFSHSDWIRRDTEHLSVFRPQAGKCTPEKLRTRTLFPQWESLQMKYFIFINPFQPNIQFLYPLKISENHCVPPGVFRRYTNKALG